MGCDGGTIPKRDELVRTKKKPEEDCKARGKKPYDKANLRKAYEATQSGMSVYRASRVFRVPESTLRDRTRCNVRLDGTPGPDKLLSLDEEKKLVYHIKYMADIGYGYTKSNIQYMAADFAKSLGKHRKPEKSLSNNWFYGFLKRWPDLKIVKAQKKYICRAKSASKDVIEKYFRELGKILTENGLIDTPERIYNIDETGINIVCSNDSNPQAIISARSANVTIIAGTNAIGNHIPPFYVFPGKRWSDELLSGAPVGSAGKMSKPGWSNSVIFESYIMDHLSKHASITEGKDRPTTLILYDGHKSHLSLTLTEWARKRNVILFVLPPHTSHLTQPLDVGIFGPFKSHYYNECQSYLQKNPGVAITRYEVAHLTAKPYVQALCSENICSAFRKSGIYPFNSQSVSASQIVPSSIYCAEKDETLSDSPISLTVETSDTRVEVPADSAADIQDCAYSQPEQIKKFTLSEVVVDGKSIDFFKREIL